eukprot:CAMPEP_0202879386 /NCGR_PEP_ID=MMETSP1391-20130828/33513_1 /ASSEMBLY_ACC=CAM_ASM_000867 /TAXON_ID=1034604 /ORGANISM="Chlamydomonas leiostraca, Strain SAG 11-49" /LENGTH=72 /DNA_ID=CAMNT_0049561719 /DNA_START=146 /DNA_END=361 /DNA_ORIENTATION=+
MSFLPADQYLAHQTMMQDYAQARQDMVSTIEELTVIERKLRDLQRQLPSCTLDPAAAALVLQSVTTIAHSSL